ncbi:MAG: TonB-dependent receptor [Bryobacteraceae bacterium]|nr:TonB-dependent receptor [Bryobacteraceae bacterium]
MPRLSGAMLALVLALLLGIAVAPVQAQVVYGSIIGTVTDPSGSAVAGAKIIITNQATGTRAETMTDEAGNYRQGQLIAGNYRVEVEAKGFQRTVTPNVPVNVDTAARVDMALVIGDVSQTVEVSAEAPLLRVDRAEVNTIFSNKQIQELPSFDRNFQAYQLLVPGNQRLGWQHASSENPQGSVQIQVNGQHFSGTDYQLDGTSNQDPILGIIVINPTFDSVTETKFATQNYDAEFGLAAAGVGVITTKSGTNELHGSAFHYLRNISPGFQSAGRNPFNSAEDRGVPPVKWNQFGGSFGGSLVKNKVFYFGDAQITRRRTGSSVLTSVPTALARTGDFSEYLEPIQNAAMVQTTTGRMVPLQRNMIFDPQTGDPSTGVGRRVFDTDGILNKIPTNRLSQQALNLIRQLPQANRRDPGSAFRRNFVNTGSEKFDSEQWTTRWDWFVNDTSSLFGRYTQADFLKFAPGAFGLLVGGAALDNIGFAGTSDVGNKSLAIGYTKTFSPTLIGDFRFGYMRYKVNVLPNGLGTSPARDAGIPNLNNDDFFTSGMPSFFINGEGGFNFGYGLGVNQCNCPLDQDEKQWQWVGNLTKIMGSHTLKFGADMRYATNLRVPSDAHRSGELSFGEGYTGFAPSAGAGRQQGLGLATFLLGQTTYFARYVSPNTDARESQKRFFFYGQDTWRATRKLTLNYGLRWEMIFPEKVNEAGNGGQLDLRTGEIVVAGVGGNSLNMIQDMNWKNFAPRLGVTYQLTDKTVVRAGYGWSYSLGTFGSIFGHNVTQNLPVLAFQQLNAPNDFSGVFTLSQGPPAPTFPQANSQGRFRLPEGVNGKSRPLNVRLPRTMAYNFTVQHQLFQDMSVQAGYVGNVGRHVFNGEGPNFNINEPAFVPGIADTNQRRPFFSRYGWTQGIDHYCNCATNRYDSLQVQVDKRFAQGLSFTVNWTWQRALGDDGSSFTFLYDRPLGWGNRENFTRHVVSVPFNAELPIGRGKRFLTNLSKPVDYLIGGWQLNGVVYATSGRPFDPYIGDFPAGTVRPNSGPGGRPDRGQGDPYEGARGDRDGFYKGGLGGYFLLPANNTFGNMPIRSLFGPKFVNFDLSAFKNIAFGSDGRYRFQLRGEFFNAFNSTHLGDPNNNVTSPEAGFIRGLAPGAQMRRLQLGARFDF